MISFTLIFEGHLNDFLSHSGQFKAIQRTMQLPSSIKDIIEAQGIPHTEVNVITANERSVDFTYHITQGDVIRVFPYNIEPLISPLIHLIPPNLVVPRFILDTHLGKLASYLRMLGFDTIYQNNLEDVRLAEISFLEDRIVLSRDLGLLKRKIITRGAFIHSTVPRQQLIEIITRYQLVDKIDPLKRCIQCNGIIEPIPKVRIKLLISEKTLRYYDEFFICSVCNQIYWKGSHYDHMQDFIKQIIQQCE